MTLKTVLIFAYALIVLVGGIIGFVKAGSVPSLVMGATSALLLFYFSTRPAACMAITASLLLFFLYRFSLSFKLMPAGMMALLSLTLLVFLLALPNEKIA